MSWRIQTGSRLHLGLLSLPPPEDTTERRFGGVGLMIDSPGVTLAASPAPGWQIEGPLARRVHTFVERLLRNLPTSDDLNTPLPPLPPRRLVVERAPREHVGLGAGTQLGLAVARLLTHSWGLGAERPTERLAAWVGRGQRSALGVYGFEQGGFLVEAGKRPGQALSPLVGRVGFPDDWRVVLIVPRQHEPGMSGADEQAAFAHLHAPLRSTEALCRLVLLGMLPALAERDLPAFGEAVFEFNVRVGEVFAPAQGGRIYASEAVAEVVALVRSLGVAGVGQSSWGPGVFAFVECQERANDLAARLRQSLGDDHAEVWITTGRSRGADIEG